jgi:hypothetical protein
MPLSRSKSDAKHWEGLIQERVRELVMRSSKKSVSSNRSRAKPLNGDVKIRSWSPSDEHQVVVVGSAVLVFHHNRVGSRRRSKPGVGRNTIVLLLFNSTVPFPQHRAESPDVLSR